MLPDQNETRPGAGGAEVGHPLVEEDRAVVSAMRARVAPFKGKMGDPGARGAFDEVMEQTPDVPGVTYGPKEIGGVAGIVCTPRAPRPATAILYLHGGAYLLGSPTAYRHLAGQFAARLNATAFVPEYRLAPEHPFPAALEDATAAYRGLVDQGVRKIVIVGDSAGGGLSLVLLSVAQSEAVAGRGLPPSAAVVMSPWTDLALTGESLRDRADDDPLLTAEMLSRAAGSYLGGRDPRDPRLSPLYGRLAGLPPVQLHVGTSEILLDDARRYAERARAAGVDATAHVWEGMPHVFPASVGALHAAERSLEEMAAFILKRLDAAPNAAQRLEKGRPDLRSNGEDDR
jgi:monoterpene epsilon-lactone hydrolase